MKRLVTAAEMRSVDRAAIEQHGMPAAVLMENAGAALTETALRLASATGRFFVLCGRGNNGGDGLVVARRLHALGRTVHVELVGGEERLSDEALRNLQALRAAGISPVAIDDALEPTNGDVVVDAIFGTGLARAPEGAFGEAVERIRHWRTRGAKVVAADLPSGLSSDTGQAFEPCVEADATCAFGLLKVGQAVEPGRSQCGAVELVDIGIPPSAWSRLEGDETWLVEEADARARLGPKRRSESHKGSYGHVLVVAGSWGKTGAAAMAAMAALRTGAGLCTVATRPEALVPVLAHAPELMGLELVNDGPLGPGDLNPLLEACDGKSALVIGPGIPRGEETAKLLETLLEELEIPVVLDADALNAVAQGRPGLLQRAQCPLVLTPHPGEMARLCGIDVPAVLKDRMTLARGFAVREQVVLVLKGAATLTATEDGAVYVNPTGNPGMATGGTGDVLSGMIGALLAQGLSPSDAAVTAVYAHGLAGDLAAARTGQMGLMATDLFKCLQDVWLRWER